MLGYWTTNQAISWWNMVEACNDFTNSTTNGLNCVWGAITTAITASGISYGAWSGIGKISTWMTNNGISIGPWKRDTDFHKGLLKDLSEVFGSQVIHLGVHHHTHPETNLTTLHDVFGFNSNGTDIHFAYLGNNTTNNRHHFKFGLGSGATAAKRSEIFNRQYFTYGGIDFNLDPFPDGLRADGGLDPDTDYGWMFDQVSCLMASDMTAGGHWFQIYDEYHQGTLAAGTLAPFMSGSSSLIIGMQIKGSLQPSTSC